MLSLSQRQEYREDSSAVTWVGTALHADEAAVLVHNSLANPQSEAGALFSLGSEERLENLRRVFRLDTRSIIRDRDANSRLV